AGVVTDPCLSLNPDPSPAAFWSVQDLIEMDGDATFFNQGALQTFFNGGSPVEIWFAPITIDNFAAFSYENDGVGGPIGPCLDINIADAFSVVYLNEIVASNLNLNAGGNGCTGTMEITGGLPEFDGSNYNITIELAADPTITGTFAEAFTHGEELKFNVPQPGLYNVNISDDVGCGIVVPMDMTGCVPVVFNIPTLNANTGDNICLPITVEDFSDIESFQFTMEWDPSVITFSTLNAVALPPFFLSNPFDPSTLTVNWVIFPFPVPTTLNDGDVAFEVCFDVVGPLGSASPVSITGNLTSIEVATSGMNNQVAVTINNGAVNVITGNIALDFTSCSSTQAASIGSFTVTPNGGIAPYSYTWEQVGMPGNTGNGVIPSNGDTAIESPLPPGNYSITVTDNGGDLQVGTVMIADADPILVQLDRMDPTCSTSSDGSISIAQIIGGVMPYTNEWSTGAMNQPIINGLTVGSYEITVTDANGCTTTDTENLIKLEVMLDTLSLTNVTCPGGGADGTISVVTTGGTIAPGSDYNYAWSTNDTGPSVSNLAPGNYCVTATDDNMCSDVMCFDIIAPIPPVFVQFDSTSVNCPNDTNGELVAIFNDGSAPISNYAWSAPGANGNTLSGISAGTYTVTVTADDGCTAVASASLFAPPAISLDQAVLTSPTCPGDSDGQIQLLISGGTEPYNISWEGGINLQVLPALACDSTYSVTISDANFCDVITESFFLPCPPEIGNVFDNLGQVSCFSGGANDGSATAIAFGGTAGTGVYNYQWSSGEVESNVVQSTATQLSRGVNTVTIDDGNCAIIDTVIIGSPPILGLDLDNTQTIEPSCFGDSDGTITVAAMGGVPPYDYQWIDPFVNDATLSNVAAGIYTVLITDFNNCNSQVNVVVGQPDPFQVLIDSTQVQSVGCSGDSSGVVAAFTQGGNLGDIIYEWNDNLSNSSVASGLPAGIYSITATDEKGCTDDVQFNLSEPDPIIFEVGDIVEPACFGFQTVVIIDTAFGGNGPLFEYSVDFGPRRPIQFPIPILGGREHTITVFDASGCSEEEVIFVDQPQEIVVDLGDDVEIQLGDSITLDPFIGSTLPLDSVVWAPLPLVTCLDTTSCLEVSVNPLETTAYSLTVFDVNGCTGSDNITVEVDRNRNVFIPNVFSPNGDGVNDIFKVFIGPGVERVNFMQVYDRWGEQLYNRNNFVPDDLGLIGWDGTLNGKTLNPGVFVYLVEVAFVDGLTLLYRGDVTLLH
ncbi:MAG: gliding motility-associated C-terminal domain-containing protein, partial [Bacteroidota bacterium]